MDERLIPTVVALALLSITGCAGRPAEDSQPEPTTPLPTGAIAGQNVTVYPLTLMVTDEHLGWEGDVQPRREALTRADSMIAVLLTERVPEVNWILPDQLRAVAARAPGMLVNPDQMGTALLRNRMDVVPDPLRNQMRNLNAVSGVRFALVPAALLFYREPEGGGRAELTVAMVEVRRGQVQWRTVARGVGAGPWEATWNALKALVPGLP
ncbi:MAG: hypothetical protein AMS18_08355 [Gemmatimonas sp. SG8_17]|nr:MAG: hypothetical protein AMS18_08355 [Gemmatimonas sp. SG8_17]